MSTELGIKGIDDELFIEISYGLSTIMAMNGEDSCHILGMVLEQLERTAPEVFKKEEFYEAILDRLYETREDEELFDLKMREYLLPYMVSQDIDEQNIGFYKKYLRFHTFGKDTPFEWELKQAYENTDILNLLCSYCGPATVLEKLFDRSYKDANCALGPEDLYDDKVILPMLDWYLNSSREVVNIPNYYKTISNDFYKFVSIWADKVPVLDSNMHGDSLVKYDDPLFQKARFKIVGFLGELTGAEEGIRMPIKLLHHSYATSDSNLLHMKIYDTRYNINTLKHIYSYCLPEYPDVIYDYGIYDCGFETLLKPVSKQLDRIEDVELYLSHFCVREENIELSMFDWKGMVGFSFSWPFNPELTKILPAYLGAFDIGKNDSDSVSVEENTIDINDNIPNDLSLQNEDDVPFS